MKRPRLSIIALVVCVLQTPLTVTADDALTATIDVLVELAEEGVVDAYYELADIAQAHPEAPQFRDEKGLQFLAMSAATGRGSAVRWLAYRLLNNGAELHEAATLISLAALIGDERAIIDLRLWPKFTPVDRETMVDGFANAIDRLATGRIVDCDALPFDCAAGMERIRSIPAADVLNAQALRDRGPFPDIASIHAIFRATHDSYAAFSEDRYREFKREQQAHNVVVQQSSSGPQEVPDDLQTEWERRAYLDRQRTRAEASRRYLDATLETDIQRYRKPLEQALERINRHRTPADHMAPDALIDTIRSPDN